MEKGREKDNNAKHQSTCDAYVYMLCMHMYESLRLFILVNKTRPKIAFLNNEAIRKQILG